jgi:hypothetical protein
MDISDVQKNTLDSSQKTSIALVASPLQYAVFKGYSYRLKNVMIIGHRGMRGNITYKHSVLNDPKFIPDFEQIINQRDAEVFLPNSLNLVYFFCVAHKHVKKISFLDEGRLTTLYIKSGFKKRRAWYHNELKMTMRLVLILPRFICKYFLSIIALFIRKIIVQNYWKKWKNYSYRTIERTDKVGVVLSHIPSFDLPEWVNFIDITKNINFQKDYSGRACLFIHPKYIKLSELISLLKKELKTSEESLLIKPHPLFSQEQNALDNTIISINKSGIHCEIACLSGEQEVSIELYARGVRTFFCGNDSSIIDTVNNYKEFFKYLKIVII